MWSFPLTWYALHWVLECYLPGGLVQQVPSAQVILPGRMPDWGCCRCCCLAVGKKLPACSTWASAVSHSLVCTMQDDLGILSRAERLPSTQISHQNICWNRHNYFNYFYQHKLAPSHRWIRVCGVGVEYVVLASCCSCLSYLTMREIIA